NILYTHGGAYVNPLSIFHWGIIQALVENVGARVVVPAYPLAPEHIYQAAYDQLEIVYRNLLDTSADQPILLCGDSAGGGLALAQVFRYRQLGLPLPQRVVLFSPWLDISMSNPGAAEVEARDILLGIQVLVMCGQWWAGGNDPTGALLSPLFGDLSALPPVDIFQGTEDLLTPDVRLLEEKISQVGGNVRLYEYTGAGHVFVGATFSPEAKHAFSQIAKVIHNS
ncbi:MAG TPA: alpha/beta hydrolase, partial [Anaerolineales bacterium]|nr:alpha/beta hydrolase [Anaerolineales bacterium]